MKNYYKILGIRESATEEEIRKQWIELAKHYHPDSGQSPRAGEKIKEINEAYQVLKYPSTRLQYDLERTYGKKKRGFHLKKFFFVISILTVFLAVGIISLKRDPVPSSSKPDIRKEINQGKPTNPLDEKKQINQADHKSAQKPATRNLASEVEASAEALKVDSKELSKLPPNDIREAVTEEVTKVVPARTESSVAFPEVTQMESVDKTSSQAVLKSETSEEIRKTVQDETIMPSLPKIERAEKAKQSGEKTETISTLRVLRTDQIEPKDSAPKHPETENAGQATTPTPTVGIEVRTVHVNSVGSSTTEEEVGEFLAAYIDRYTRKDIEGFLSFFSSKAIQNNKDGFKKIRKIYTDFFRESLNLAYRLRYPKIEISANGVRVRSSYEIKQVHKAGDIRQWNGNIEWELVREGEQLKISTLQYQHDRMR